jgi:gamma-glutamyltranspeptidase/glutathione hydrolase
LGRALGLYATLAWPLPFLPPLPLAAAQAPVPALMAAAQPPTPSLGRPSARNPAITTLTPTSTLPTPAPSPAPNTLQESRERFHPLLSSGGIVAAQEGLAAAAGARQLRAGGNAVDAAVATAFALAVTHPEAGNLGGGGFLLLWLPGPSHARGRGCLPAGQPSPERPIGGGISVAVNFREVAPRAATAAMFLNPDGSVNRQRATRSALSAGVPGSVAGLVLAQRCYGRLPLATVLAPAIALAADGFPVTPTLQTSLTAAAPRLQADPAARALFYRPGPDSPPRPPRLGDRLRQPQLAATLRRIAALGAPGFYDGPVAQALARLMAQRGGLITTTDLRAYEARLVPPLERRFRGHPILTMPPPGGGLTLLQLLALLEPFPLDSTGMNSARTLHLMVEAMNLAYRDRNDLLGDPDQIALPTPQLLSDAYLGSLRQQLSAERHQPPSALPPRPPWSESPNTTHLSVADRQGGLVALTVTLNFPYGSGLVVPEAGFLLNNEMDDFTASPGQPNAFGLLQGEANAIAPGRRPLSSMAPTLVFRPDGRPWIATGSPGGSRITTTIAQVLLNRLVHGRNLATAVTSPRVHSQLFPDTLSHEEGVSPDTLRLLNGMGHTLRPSSAMGAAHSVEVRSEGGSAAALDPRRAEAAAVAE